MRQESLLRRFHVGRAVCRPLRTGLCLVFAAFVAVTTMHAQTGWKLVWSDNFNGPAGAPPDPANWKFQAGPGRYVGGNEEAEVYCSYGSTVPPCRRNAPNAYLDGHGHLVIVAIRTNQTLAIPGTKIVSPVYTSARLDSLKSFRYGRIEASIRVPTGQGVWPAFWGLGVPGQSLNWPEIGEMDIMESWNPQPGTTDIDPYLNHGSVHGPIAPGSKTGYVNVTGTYAFPRPMQDAFHQFAVEWSPGEVDFYCDGNLYSRQSVGSLSDQQVWEMDNAPFYLLLNLAMGGNFFGYPNQTTPSTVRMVVDYVRVYRSDATLLPMGWGNADIGGPNEAGYTSSARGVWTVAGSGNGTRGQTDEFQFAYKALGGDGEISSRVPSQSSRMPQAEAGLMLRDGRGSGAAFAMLFVSPDRKIHFRSRAAGAQQPDDVTYRGRGKWLKLVRSGNIFTGFASTTGKSWTRVADAELAMGRDALAGLVSTAGDNGTPDVARFTHVLVSGSEAAWDGTPATIPGVVQAEEFDAGGPGYAYSPAWTHQGVSPFRPRTGPAIRQIATHGEPNVVPGGYYLSNLPPKVCLNYTVRILKPGHYIFRVRIASKGHGGSIHFNLDQKPVTGEVWIWDTGGSQQWAIASSRPVFLPAGEHVISLVTDSAGPGGTVGNVDYFTVRPE